MPETADTRLPRLAPILLIAALIAIAVARPGILAGDTDLVYRFLTTLSSTAAIAYIAWRFHGIIPAAATILLFQFALPGNPEYSAYLERGMESVPIVTVAVGIGACSRQGRPGQWPWFLLAITSIGLAYFGWYGWELPIAKD